MTVTQLCEALLDLRLYHIGEYIGDLEVTIEGCDCTGDVDSIVIVRDKDGTPECVELKRSR